MYFCLVFFLVWFTDDKETDCLLLIGLPNLKRIHICYLGTRISYVDCSSLCSPEELVVNMIFGVLWSSLLL